MSLSTLGQAVLAGLANGAFYALLALSFGIILTLTRALNLAHGELIVLGGYVGYATARGLGAGPVLLMLVAALALLPLGLLWRALIARVREPIELNSLLLTFGLSLLLQNGMLATWSADYRLIASPAAGAWPLGLASGRATAAGLGLGAILVLHLLVRRTRWGLALRALSRDAETAALLGVNTDRVSTASFAVAAAIAGAGGVLFARFHYLHPAAGVELTLQAITLALLAEAWGARRRLPALLGAGLAIGVAESLVLVSAGPQWRELVVATLLLGVLVVRAPGGHR
jgi:branched-chain amino acid transport system permease protein